MAIYNKNQATVSQSLTEDFSRLSNEDDEMLFDLQEHIICQKHQIQESWLNIIGLNTPPTCHLVKIFSFHLNLRKIGFNSAFPQILHSSMFKLER